MNYTFLIVLAIVAVVISPLLVWGIWHEADRTAAEEIRRRKDKL